MQPDTPPVPSVEPTKIPARRHFLAAFFISFMWGMFGVDRMYLGMWGTGILKFLTVGGFGIWTIVDLIMIMNGSMRDKWGRELLEFAEYKKLAQRIVLIFAIVMGLFALVTGLALIAAVAQLMTEVQNGTFMIPGLEGLQSPILNPEQL